MYRLTVPPVPTSVKVAAFYRGRAVKGLRCAAVEATKAGGQSSTKLCELATKKGSSKVDFLEKLREHCDEEHDMSLSEHEVDRVAGSQMGSSL